MAEPTVVHWHGFTIDTQNDGNGESPVGPGQRFHLRLYRSQPRGPLLVSSAPARRHRRPGTSRIAGAVHGRGRRRARAAPCAGTRVRRDGDPAAADRSRAAAQPIRTAPPRPTCCTAGTATRRSSISRRVRFATSPPAAIVCACSTVPTRAFSGWGSPAMAAVRCRSCSSAPTAACSSDPWRSLRSLSRRPNASICWLTSPDCRSAASCCSTAARSIRCMRSCTPRRSTESSASMADHGAEIGSGSAMATSHGDGGAFALLQFRIRERGGNAATVPGRLSTMPAAGPSTGDDRPLRLGFAKGRWRINDLVYDTGATPIVVVRSTVETWLIRNYHTSMPHAMHLHGFQFRVLGRETSPDQLAPLAVDEQRSACHGSRAQGHDTCLAGRIGEDRDRLRASVCRSADLSFPLPQSRARGRRDDAAGAGRLTPDAPAWRAAHVRRYNRPDR